MGAGSGPERSPFWAEEAEGRVGASGVDFGLLGSNRALRLVLLDWSADWDLRRCCSVADRSVLVCVLVCGIGSVGCWRGSEGRLLPARPTQHTSPIRNWLAFAPTTHAPVGCNKLDPQLQTRLHLPNQTLLDSNPPTRPLSLDPASAVSLPSHTARSAIPELAAMLDLDGAISILLRKKLLGEALIKEICEKTKELLMRESNVVHIQAPVTVVGDIHGQAPKQTRIGLNP